MALYAPDQLALFKAKVFAWAVCFFFTVLAMLLAFCYLRSCRCTRGKQVVVLTADKASQAERQDFEGLTVAGLQDECRRQGLKATGLRAELIA